MNHLELENLFFAIQPRLLRHALTQLDPSAARDAVQTTWLVLLSKPLASPSNDHEERQLRSLAYQVLAGHIRNEYRARRRRQALQRRIGLLEGAGDMAQDNCSAIDDEDAIKRWIEQLSAEDQQVIRLLDAGFDVAETAKILGCTPAAAAKRRTRARHRLRAVVREERGGVTRW